jgi:hypothetical protein
MRVTRGLKAGVLKSVRISPWHSIEPSGEIGCRLSVGMYTLDICIG